MAVEAENRDIDRTLNTSAIEYIYGAPSNGEPRTARSRSTGSFYRTGHHRRTDTCSVRSLTMRGTLIIETHNPCSPLQDAAMFPDLVATRLGGLRPPSLRRHGVCGIQLYLILIRLKNPEGGGGWEGGYDDHNQEVQQYRRQIANTRLKSHG